MDNDALQYLPGIALLRNTAGGTGALQSSSLTGLENTAFGYWALLDNTSGSDNTAFGAGALEFSTKPDGMGMEHLGGLL